MTRKRIFSVIRLLAYAAFLLFFVFLPLQTVEKESFCQWYNTFGLICPTCGFTRGFTNFMHFDFIRAFLYNPVLTLFAAPAALFVMAQDIFVMIKRKIKKTDELSFAEFLLNPMIYFKN